MISDNGRVPELVDGANNAEREHAGASSTARPGSSPGAPTNCPTCGLFSPCRCEFAALGRRIGELESNARYRQHQLNRAVAGLRHIASFWKDKPSGGYAAACLEDIDP